jgi:hypothetical protein
MAKEKQEIGFLHPVTYQDEPNLTNLKKLTIHYSGILANTERYRADWNTHLSKLLFDTLTDLSAKAGLQGEVVMHEKMENLCAVQFSLGSMLSGMAESVTKNVQRSLIKHNGSLVYQQLFHGKIMIVINLPYIEGYGQPTPPRNLAIMRPEEISKSDILKHLETFIEAVTAWEDFDDDIPAEPNQAIGFKLNFDQEHSLNTK